MVEEPKTIVESKWLLEGKWGKTWIPLKNIEGMHDFVFMKFNPRIWFIHFHDVRTTPKEEDFHLRHPALSRNNR